MNRFTPDNQSVLDATDNPWPVNTWHPIPIPEGIEISATYPRSLAAGFWLVQTPLPPVPALTKTQLEIDAEAMRAWMADAERNVGVGGVSIFSIWISACRYARQQMAPEGIV